MNHRQPLSKYTISIIYSAMVPHYHWQDEMLLNISFHEQFTFKEPKNDLNPTILAATTIIYMGDLDRTPLTNGNN